MQKDTLPGHMSKVRPHLLGLPLLLAIQATTCYCAILDCDLKLSLSTTCPLWQKVEGSEAGQSCSQHV